jgi:hypothetical protein
MIFRRKKKEGDDRAQLFKDKQMPLERCVERQELERIIIRCYSKNIEMQEYSLDFSERTNFKESVEQIADIGAGAIPACMKILSEPRRLRTPNKPGLLPNEIVLEALRRIGDPSVIRQLNELVPNTMRMEMPENMRDMRVRSAIREDIIGWNMRKLLEAIAALALQNHGTDGYRDAVSGLNSVMERNLILRVRQDAALLLGALGEMGCLAKGLFLPDKETAHACRSVFISKIDEQETLESLDKLSKALEEAESSMKNSGKPSEESNRGMALLSRIHEEISRKRSVLSEESHKGPYR